MDGDSRYRRKKGMDPVDKRLECAMVLVEYAVLAVERGKEEDSIEFKGKNG
jgi:hypothetical protein